MVDLLFQGCRRAGGVYRGPPSRSISFGPGCERCLSRRASVLPSRSISVRRTSAARAATSRTRIPRRRSRLLSW